MKISPETKNDNSNGKKSIQVATTNCSTPLYPLPLGIRTPGDSRDGPPDPGPGPVSCAQPPATEELWWCCVRAYFKHRYLTPQPHTHTRAAHRCPPLTFHPEDASAPGGWQIAAPRFVPIFLSFVISTMLLGEYVQQQWSVTVLTFIELENHCRNADSN